MSFLRHLLCISWSHFPWRNLQLNWEIFTQHQTMKNFLQSPRLIVTRRQRVCSETRNNTALYLYDSFLLCCFRQGFFPPFHNILTKIDTYAWFIALRCEESMSHLFFFIYLEDHNLFLVIAVLTEYHYLCDDRPLWRQKNIRDSIKILIYIWLSGSESFWIRWWWIGIFNKLFFRYKYSKKMNWFGDGLPIK